MNNLGRDTLVRPSCCAKSHGILVFQMTSKSYESQDYIENSGIRAVFVSLHCFANAQMLERDTRPAQEHRRLHRRVNAASVCLLPAPGRPSEACRQKQTQILSLENGHTHMNKSRQAATYQQG